MVKAVFPPDLTKEQSPAIARVTRLSGLLLKRLMDRVYALPKQARRHSRETLHTTPTHYNIPTVKREVYFYLFSLLKKLS